MENSRRFLPIRGQLCELHLPSTCCSILLLEVESSTRRTQRNKVKVLHAAFRISGIAPVAVEVYRKTPNEVEVSAGVEEGGSEAKDEDVEEPAQFPMLPPLVYLPAQLSHLNALSSLQLLKHIFFWL